MDIETLKTFLVLVETKNFTRTANQIFVAQSTITNRINELEKELGVRLFIRNNRSVELTIEGMYFKTYAEKVIELTDTCFSELSSLNKFENHLSIGASESIYEGHLAPIILNYQKEHPEDSLKISIGLSTNLIEQLQDDILDVVFTYLPLKKAHFHCSIFRQDTLVLVTDIHNTKFRNGISKEALLTVNYLMCNFALQDVGMFIRNIFPKHHQFSLEIDDCSKIIPFLIGEDTYTFLPEDMAKPFVENKSLQIIPLTDLQTPVINSYIIFNSSKKELCENIFKLNGGENKAIEGGIQMTAKNLIHLKDLGFDNTRFWAYFLSVNYPCAVLEESDCSMYDLVKEVLPVDTKWSDEFTGYYDGVLDETDGYLEEPTTLFADLGDSDVLKIEFHPGDTVFYINDTEIGSTGPHWDIQKIPWHRIRKLLYLEDGAVLFQLLLPMVMLKPDDITDLKPILEKHFSDLGFVQPVLSKVIDCLISGII